MKNRSTAPAPIEAATGSPPRLAFGALPPRVVREGGRSEAEKELTRNHFQWFIAAMKGFPPMNRLNNSFGRNAVRLLGVLFLFSLLTPRHLASGETVRFAGDSDLVGVNGRWTRAVAEQWAKKTNKTVEYTT